MEKRVFRNFRYSECDDFAAYLSKMASNGWHFKGWRFGLIFEKCEPEAGILWSEWRRAWSPNLFPLVAAFTAPS